MNATLRDPCYPPACAPGGHAVLTLAGGLADLLRPVVEWGAVRVTVHNSLVELDTVLDLAVCEAGSAGYTRLSGAGHEIWLSERGVARIELRALADDAERGFEMRWFDVLGRRIASLSPLHQAGREKALRWLRPHQAGAQGRATKVPSPVMCAPLVDFASVDALARGPAAAAWVAAVLAQLEPARRLRLDLGGVGAAMRLGGTLACAAGLLVASDLDCRLMLDPARATAVSRVVARDGVRSVLVSDDAGSSLLLRPLGEGAGTWFDAVARLVLGGR